ncbi:hypothetical protein DL93DRAFT_1185289 [Clavulina sp. PMI_390]|nr:hypothetical protein DL93DRAFT_1185289 [Clavulina sp. PMI_390]
MTGAGDCHCNAREKQRKTQQFCPTLSVRARCWTKKKLFVNDATCGCAALTQRLHTLPKDSHRYLFIHALGSGVWVGVLSDMDIQSDLSRPLCVTHSPLPPPASPSYWCHPTTLAASFLPNSFFPGSVMNYAASQVPKSCARLTSRHPQPPHLIRKKFHRAAEFPAPGGWIRCYGLRPHGPSATLYVFYSVNKRRQISRVAHVLRGTVPGLDRVSLFFFSFCAIRKSFQDNVSAKPENADRDPSILCRID